MSKLPYDFKSDIWSLGCVFYELTSLKVPFRAKNIDELKEKIFSGENPKISSKYSKDLSTQLSKERKAGVQWTKFSVEGFSAPKKKPKKAKKKQIRKDRRERWRSNRRRRNQ